YPQAYWCYPVCCVAFEWNPVLSGWKEPFRGNFIARRRFVSPMGALHTKKSLKYIIIAIPGFEITTEQII
ncbi:MAG TPA: hypothetical protein VIS10_00935, partial [Anaerolineales bacterium]